MIDKAVDVTSDCKDWGTITRVFLMVPRPRWQRIIGLLWRPWSKPQTIEGWIGDDPK